jgi:hypothetical protein
MTRFERVFFILCAALVASACVAQSDDVAPLDDEMEDIVSMYEDSLDLVRGAEHSGATRMLMHKKFKFGGTSRPEDRYPEVGKQCSRQYVRVEPPVVTYTGHGYCEFDSWVAPDDPTNCTAYIHVHHAGNRLYGECRVEIFEQRQGPSQE